MSAIDTKTIELSLNLPCIEVSKVVMRAKALEVHCHSILDEILCPNCLKKTSKVHQTDCRQVRDLSITGRVVELHSRSRQFYCSDCHRYFHERFDFVQPSKTMATRYELYLYDCCGAMDLRAVAARENAVWETLQRIYEHQLRER